MIEFSVKGNWTKTTSYLKRIQRLSYLGIFDNYGQAGVQALSSATPTDSGLTADSWVYRVENKRGRLAIHWSNTNVNDGVNIAVILQYGHGTGTGGYVQGRDYINPALRPIFDEITKKLWEEVTK